MKVQLLPSWQAFTPGQVSSCHCMQLLLHPVVTHLSCCRSKPFSPESASTVQTQSQDSSSPWKLQNMLDVWKGVHADPKEERCRAEASESSAGEAGSPLPPQQDLADEHPQVIWAPQALSSSFASRWIKASAPQRKLTRLWFTVFLTQPKISRTTEIPFRE